MTGVSALSTTRNIQRGFAATTVATITSSAIYGYRLITTVLDRAQGIGAVAERVVQSGSVCFEAGKELANQVSAKGVSKSVSDTIMARLPNDFSGFGDLLSQIGDNPSDYLSSTQAALQKNPIATSCTEVVEGAKLLVDEGKSLATALAAVDRRDPLSIFSGALANSYTIATIATSISDTAVDACCDRFESKPGSIGIVPREVLKLAAAAAIYGTGTLVSGLVLEAALVHYTASRAISGIGRLMYG
jgi:hypothetical protein